MDMPPVILPRHRGRESPQADVEEQKADRRRRWVDRCFRLSAELREIYHFATLIYRPKVHVGNRLFPQVGWRGKVVYFVTWHIFARLKYLHRALDMVKLRNGSAGAREIVKGGTVPRQKFARMICFPPKLIDISAIELRTLVDQKFWNFRMY